jgi:hypothetical protein
MHRICELIEIGLGVLALEQAGFMELFKSESKLRWRPVLGEGVAIGLCVLALE